jgi:hypothetical protein
MPHFRVTQGFRWEGRVLRVGDVVEWPAAGQMAHALKEIPAPVEHKEPEEFKAAGACYGRKSGDWPTLYRVGLFVTGECNIKCGLCSQLEYRQAHGHLSLETARLVVQQVKATGIRPFLSITGGEPTLWPHLEEFAAEAANSGAWAGITMFSNIKDPEMLARILRAGHVSKIYTNRANCNNKGADDLLAEFGPERVSVSDAGHIPMPKKATWNCLPAICHCPGVAVQGDFVYACPNMYSIGERIGRPVALYDLLRRPVNSDWIGYFQAHEAEKYRSWFCQFCPSNKAYKKGVAEGEKVHRYSSGI